MSQIKVGSFQGNGADVNVPVGFVPDFVWIHNRNATTGEKANIVWFGPNMGDSKEYNSKILVDNGSTGNANLAYVASGGDISEYDSANIDAGTASTESDPVRNKGFMGFTVQSTFCPTDNDVCDYIAIKSDTTQDHGDINNL